MRAASIACLLAAAAAAACRPAPDDSLFASGYAEADLVYVAAAASGTLQSVLVARGAVVRRGQPLFTLDADAEALAVSAAQARRQRAEAQAADLHKGRRPLEIEAIDAQLLQARAALAASTSLLERQHRLLAQGFVAAAQLDEVQAAHDRDAARVRELQAQRAQALQASRSDAVAAAEAEARGSRADAELARWREGQRRREAPADGEVFDVFYRAGEWVGAGAPVLALMPPGALKLRFFVAQAQLVNVRVGAEVAVQCDGCGAGFKARVTWVSPQAEYTPPVIYSNASRAKLVFLVEAAPDAAARAALKPGQPLDVRLPSGAPAS